jgi:hypothetical protein
MPIASDAFREFELVWIKGGWDISYNHQWWTFFKRKETITGVTESVVLPIPQDIKE